MSFQPPIDTTWKMRSGTTFGWRRSAGRKRTGQAPTKGPYEKHIWELFGGSPGEKPLLGRGNRLWTMAGLFWAMAVMDRIDGWTNGEYEDAACVEPWRATCCMLLDPYKRGGNLKLGESKEKDCLNGERAPALPSSGNSMHGSQISSWHYMKTKFWRSWVMTLRFLVYGNAVY